jgi:cytochrome b561
MQVTYTDPPAPSYRHPRSYGRGAIAFHWTVAVLLILVGLIGLLHDSWPKRSHEFWINIHALAGLMLWAAVLARLCWRVTHTPPPLPAAIGALYRRSSRALHFTVYALLFVTPIIGIVAFIWHGRAFELGLFQVNFGVASDRSVFESTEDLHGYLAYALFTLAAVHILAALWHRFVRRDGVLERMWPWAAAARPPSVRAAGKGD